MFNLEDFGIKLKRSKRQTVSVDFDGVLHSYTTPWIAPYIIPDDPVPGAIKWLVDTIQTYDVQILSTRCLSFRGRRAIRKWLKKYSGPDWYGWVDDVPLSKIKITCKKYPALIYIDDRAFRFTGSNFPSTERIRGTRPWIKDR